MTTRTSLWRSAVIVFAVGQVVSPSLLFLTGNDSLTSGGTETPITPPGWTFAVWGLVCLLSLGYAVYQRPRKENPLNRDLDRLAPPLAVVFALYSLWLAVAAVDVVAVTVVIFAAMLIFLLRAARVFADSPDLAQTGGPRLLVGWLIGVYTGWTSVAVFINLSAAVRQAGAPISSPAGLVWQGVLLAAAAAVATVITYRWRAPWPYVLTVIWALAGAATSTYQRGALALCVECGAGIVVVLATTYLARRRGRRGERMFPGVSPQRRFRAV